MACVSRGERRSALSPIVRHGSTAWVICIDRRSAGTASHGVIVRSARARRAVIRSEEHTSELQSLVRISNAVFCLKKKKNKEQKIIHRSHNVHQNGRQKR